MVDRAQGDAPIPAEAEVESGSAAHPGAGGGRGSAWAEEVRGLQLVEVTSAEEGQLWNELVIREHPLRQCRLVGRQLRYLVGLDHGWLGAIGFGSAALYLAGRDAWLGWTADQRMEHLPRVLQIQMNRFFDPSGRPV